MEINVKYTFLFVALAYYRTLLSWDGAVKLFKPSSFKCLMCAGSI